MTEYERKRARKLWREICRAMSTLPIKSHVFRLLWEFESTQDPFFPKEYRQAMIDLADWVRLKSTAVLAEAHTKDLYRLYYVARTGPLNGRASRTDVTAALLGYYCFDPFTGEPSYYPIRKVCALDRLGRPAVHVRWDGHTLDTIRIR